MFRHQLSEVSKLGDADETYGQAYWGNLSDELTPVKFNSKNEHIGVGDTIEFEEKALKKSAKGTEYFQLRKVRVVEDNAPKQAESGSGSSQLTPVTQLDRIEAKLDKLLGNDVELSGSDELKPEGDYDQSVDEEPTMPEDWLKDVE